MIKLEDYLETNDKMLLLRLPQSVLKRIKKRARKHNTTKSKYVRAAILMMLNEDDPQHN